MNENTNRLIEIIDRIIDGREVFFHYVRTVADLMSSDLAFLTLDHKIADGLYFLKENGVKDIPIVEREEQRDGRTSEFLVGTVSERDLLRMMSGTFGTLAQTEADEKTLRFPLGTAIRRNVPTVGPTMPLLDAVQVMVEQRSTCLPVVEGSEKDRRPLGILTSADIIRCFIRLNVLRRARQDQPTRVRLIDLMRGQEANQPSELLLESLMPTAADVMKDTFEAVDANVTIGNAINILKDKRISHLAVLKEHGKLLGILSDLDILRFLPPPSALRGISSQVAFVKYRDETDPLHQLDPDDKELSKALREKVSSVLTGDPLTVHQTASLVEVAKTFWSNQVEAVAVVDSTDSSRLIGMATQNDFLGAFTAIGRVVCRNQLL